MPLVRIALGDKVEPVFGLTSEIVRNFMTNVIAAPRNSKVGGPYSDVRGGHDINLKGSALISRDKIQTIPRVALGRQTGGLLAKQESEFGTADNRVLHLEDASAFPDPA